MSASGRGPTRRTIAQVAIVVTTFAVGGLVAGWLWERAWTPVVGIAFKGRFAVVGEATGQEFSATGSFVLVAAAVGLVLGAALALVLRDAEVLTLLSSAASAGAAGWLMARVGHLLGPPDPQAAAATLADWTKVPLDLTVAGVSPYLAFPFGAVLGVALGLLTISLAQMARSGTSRPGAR